MSVVFEPGLAFRCMFAMQAFANGIQMLSGMGKVQDPQSLWAVKIYKALLPVCPIHHRLTDRVEAHVLICMLACYLVWHLRKAWAPLTFTDEHPPQPDNPVAPAQRSADAHTKAARKHDPAGNPLRSFRGLLDHLATLTRNQIRYQDTNIEVPMLTEPTPDQRRAFDLLNIPIPLTAAG